MSITHYDCKLLTTKQVADLTVNNAARNERIKITATWFNGASVAALACAVVCSAIATQGAAAQTGNTNKSVRRWVNRDAESKKNFIYGIADGIGKKYLNIRVSQFAKYLENAADFPAKWDDDIGPSIRDCIERSQAR